MYHKSYSVTVEPIFGFYNLYKNGQYIGSFETISSLRREARTLWGN